MVKTISSKAYIQLLEIYNGIHSQSEVIIPSNTITEFSVSLQTGNQNTSIIFQLIYFDYNGLFIDNLNLKVQ